MIESTEAEMAFASAGLGQLLLALSGGEFQAAPGLDLELYRSLNFRLPPYHTSTLPDLGTISTRDPISFGTWLWCD